MKKSTAKIICCCAAFCLLSAGAFAQIHIAGKVSEPSGRPVPHTTVVLLDTKGKLVTAAFTDSLGRYRLESPAKGAMQLMLSSMEYETAPFFFNLQRDTSILLTGTLKQRRLQTVEVTAARPVLEQQADRIVFNPDRSITAAGSDGMELLAKIPGVRVTGDRIDIAGKGAVRVMVNGRLVRLTDTELENYLRSIAAADIRKIEVITAPSAQYDADGNAGLINIVTRRDRNPGFTGSVQGNYKRNNFDNGNLGGNVTWNTGRWALAAGVNANKGRLLEGFESDVYFPRATWQLSDTGDFSFRTLNTSFNADYTLSKRSVIGVSHTYGFRNYKGSDHVFNPYYSQHATPDSILRTYAEYDPVALTHTFNLHYIAAFDSAGTKLSIDGDYLTFNRRDTSRFNSNSFGPAGQEMPWGHAQYFNTAKQRIRIYTLKADLDIPTAFANWSVGGKINFIDNYSNAFYYRLPENIRDQDGSRSSEFSYKENTQALYVSATKSIHRWTIQAGLRGEYTTVKGLSLLLGEENEQRYFKLFPSALVSYGASEQHQFAFTFSKRINRPTFWSLNPYKSLTTDYSYFEGNPFLQPEFVSNAELTHTYRKRLRSSLYLSVTNNGFDNITFADPSSTTFYRTPVNFLTTVRYGVSEALTLQPAPWFESTNQVNLYQTHARSALAAIGNRELFSAYLSTANSFTLNSARTLSAGFTAWYQFADMDHAGKTDPYYRVDAGIKYQLLQQRLTLSLTGNDLFRSSMPTVYNTVNNIPQRYVNFQYERNLTLAFTYKFGNRKMKTDTHESGNKEERSRVR
ncbi:outer membrane beta-barrel protein [Chitinophaga lutea]